jgi:hypothetical protein
MLLAATIAGASATVAVLWLGDLGAVTPATQAR